MLKNIFSTEYNINVESPIVNKINEVSKKILLLCAFAHMSYLIIFTFIGIKELVIFNIFSIICYLILQSKPFSRTIPILFFTLHLEVTLHASFAIILLGWDCGFSYLILCLITLVYISPFKNKKLPYIYASIEIITFTILKWYCMNYDPIYNNALSNHYENLFFFYNLFLCFIIIFFLSKLNSSTNDLAQYILTETNKNLEKNASHDPLTNLLNRRFIQTKFIEAIAERNLIGRMFCIVIGDIDDFKIFNDTYGHFCGDFILKGISEKMLSSLRNGDYVCRWGGEEFLFILYDVSIENAKLAIERIRISIENEKWIYEDNELSVTMTFGISCCNNNKTIEYSIEEADKCLYKGKKSGKNCVIIE